VFNDAPLIHPLTALCRWLVVGFHEPYYSSQGTYQLGTYFKQNLEALFYQYGVDIVITGHVHAYERSYPVFNGTVRLPSHFWYSLKAGPRTQALKTPRCPRASSTCHLLLSIPFLWFYPASSQPADLRQPASEHSHV